MRVEYTRDFAIILLVWVAMVALVNPIGDFPLNDDWSYARPVHSLVTSGTLELLDWPAMTLISHVLWGALVSLLFGFSFMTLRVSTLLLAVLALFVFYKTLREVGANRSIARWGTFIIAANPLFVNLANTFMTDVPFFAFAMLSTLFFIRALKHLRRSDLWIAVLLAVVASLIRQLGLIMPVAFAAAYIYRNGYSKKILVRACIPFVATLLVLIAFQIYLRQVQDIPAAFEEKTQVLLKRLTTEPRTVLDMILRSSAKSVIYLGLFLLPFTILFTRQKPFALEGKKSRLPMAAFAAVVALLGTFLIVTGKLLPMLQNMIYDFGLGPPTLRDVYILDLLHLPRAPRGLWLAVTIAGIVGGSAALIFTIQTVSRLFRRKIDIETRTRGAITLFIAGVGVLYFLPLSIIGVFDRYLLFCLPLA
ncbi:MAG: glycosyltransferase family 39 protein, partial [bacterium]